MTDSFKRLYYLKLYLTLQYQKNQTIFRIHKKGVFIKIVSFWKSILHSSFEFLCLLSYETRIYLRRHERNALLEHDADSYCSRLWCGMPKLKFHHSFLWLKPLRPLLYPPFSAPLSSTCYFFFFLKPRLTRSYVLMNSFRTFPVGHI